MVYPGQLADRGLPREGDRASTHDLVKCSQKLHKIELIWTPEEEGRGQGVPTLPLDPTMRVVVKELKLGCR